MSDELVLTIDPPYIGSAVSPEVDITETDTTYTVDITDFRGVHSYTVEKTDQAIADAETAATNANTAAANATSTANAAAQYARDTADQAAADAQETADAAAGRADAAAASANQAAQSANTAAGTANTSAQNADAKAALADSKAALANQAATTANTAAEAAEAAKTAADTAAGQATSAAENANSKAALADSKATLADAAATTATNAAQAADTATQAANTATTAANNAAQAANNAADVAIEAAEDMPKLVATVDTVQTVNDAWPAPPRAAALYGKCVQDGTPTPSTPVPVQVVSGRNLIKPTQRTVTASGVTYKANADGSITLTGTATGNDSFSMVPGGTSEVRTYAAGTYTVSKSNGVARVNFSGISTNTSLTRTFSSTFATGSFSILIESGVTYNETFSIQLETGTQATPYLPYGYIGLQIGETVHPIDPQGHTLAGGDVLNIDSAGRVWIEQNTDHITLNGTETWFKHGSIASWFFIDGLISTLQDNSRTNTMLSNRFVQKSYNGAALLNNGEMCAGYPNNDFSLPCRIAIKNTACATVEEFKTWLANNPVTIVYELATSQTIELGTIELPELTNPCELAIYASLDPEWAIEYEQDPNAVITSLQASIAPVEGSTASTNYAVNSYLIHANQLYRVTSAIATGEAITPGSNCVACTVMGEVIRLTA